MLSDLMDMRNLQNLWTGVETVFNPGGLRVLEQNYLARTDNPRLKKALHDVADPVLKRPGAVVALPQFVD